MLYQILVHTPRWVWGVLILLLWLGLSQTMPWRASLRRVILLPLLMTGLSLHGMLSGFGAMNAAWVLWLGAALGTTLWVASGELPAQVQYDAERRIFKLPGSWVPLGLILSIFLTKYVVGVLLAMEPALAHDIAVAAIVASLYGTFSGVFVGRMLRMLRLARASVAPTVASAPVAWG